MICGDIVCGKPLCKMFFSAISSFLGKSIGNWTFRIRDAYTGDSTLNSALLLFVQNHIHCQQKILKLMTLSCIQPNKHKFTIQFTSQSETEKSFGSTC
jgi:hypothetical protein